MNENKLISADSNIDCDTTVDELLAKQVFSLKVVMFMNSSVKKLFTLWLLTMTSLIFLLHVCAIVEISFGQKFQHLKQVLRPSVHPNIQEQSALEVIRRVFNDDDLARLFHVQIDPDLDHGVLSVDNQGQVLIKGPSGVMATWTFHEYLRKVHGVQISWRNRQLRLTFPFPPEDGFIVTGQDLIRFYQNPCVYGYSFAFWSWLPDWSDHLDWMALNGINLALAASGQELIWRQTYRSLGLETLENFFTGKAFLPWNRMGNLKAWAGPLSLGEMQSAADLQRRILKRMLSLAITPVIPAFNGIVPEEMLSLFPNETFYPLR